MNRKFLQFTIGAANALVKKFVPAQNEWFIEFTSTTVLTMTHVGGTSTADVLTITFTTADANYASHNAVINALALANEPGSAPNAIITPALPLVGATQQLITSIALA
jgi:hypothetical protein